MNLAKLNPDFLKLAPRYAVHRWNSLFWRRQGNFVGSKSVDWECDSESHDTTRMPVEVGPPWMGKRPFDPRMTGLPTATGATRACMVWVGHSDYAHL